VRDHTGSLITDAEHSFTSQTESKKTVSLMSEKKKNANYRRNDGRFSPPATQWYREESHPETIALVTHVVRALLPSIAFLQSTIRVKVEGTFLDYCTMRE
jgi:hypothetical protein